MKDDTIVAPPLCEILKQLFHIFGIFYAIPICVFANNHFHNFISKNDASGHTHSQVELASNILKVFYFYFLKNNFNGDGNTVRGHTNLRIFRKLISGIYINCYFQRTNLRISGIYIKCKNWAQNASHPNTFSGICIVFCFAQIYIFFRTIKQLRDNNWAIFQGALK